MTAVSQVCQVKHNSKHKRICRTYRRKVTDFIEAEAQAAPHPTRNVSLLLYMLKYVRAERHSTSMMYTSSRAYVDLVITSGILISVSLAATTVQ